MSVSGYGKNIPEKIFYQLGENLEIDAAHVRRIFSEINEALTHWGSTAKSLGIANETIQSMQKQMGAQFKLYRSLA